MALVRNRGPLLLSHGRPQAVEPLLLVVDVADMKSVGLAVGGVQRAHAEDILGFVSISESPSEGPPHADLSILQVLESQVPDRNGLAVHLEAAPVVPRHRSRQNQELGEEEHV